MKNNLRIGSCLPLFRLSVVVVVFSVMFHRSSVAEAMPVGISFQVFYDELMPYGDWVSDPVHGYVWVPYAEPGFQPYATNGYWVMSTYGNTWVSNYDWGWAPFHYGRWYFDDYLGWAWVPGYEWGPAWVNWRTGGDYYGWAPLMPGLGIQVSINIPANYWVFVPRRRLVSRNIYNYYVPRRNVYKIYNQTTVINNTYVYNNNTYVSGPARREVEAVTRRSVPVYQVNNSDKPGRTAVGRNRLQIYQPAVRRTADNGDVHERPSRVYSANEHKANLVTRNSSRSSANVRTAPTNSRTNGNARPTEVLRTQTGSAGQAAVRSQTPVRGNENVSRTQTPSRNERTLTPESRDTPRQSRQQPATNRQSSTRQQPSNVSSRTQTAPQGARDQAAQQRQSVQQSPRQSAPSQEVRRGANSTSRISPANTSQRSSGNTSRTSSQSRGSSRGNN